MEANLLEQFDELIAKRGYANRSEAIRDIIRAQLVKQEWEEGEEVVGIVTLLYDHHTSNISALLTDLQHEYHNLILSTMHIHLDEDNCLEVLAVKGGGRKVEQVASRLIGAKGVKHGKLTATSTGRRL
jgi:CopG family nickel-responsive transcriptional regulator